MNCPLCGEVLEENSVCPICAGVAEASAETPKYERNQALPGIFLENMELAQADFEAERRPKKKQYFSGGERLQIAGGLILLLLFLALVYLFSCRYDSAANAVVGTGSIEMTNAEFAVYYYSAYYDYLSQNSDGGGNVNVPFRGDYDLDKQYYHLETGYSWQDYFMDTALQNAALTLSLIEAARQEEFDFSQDAMTPPEIPTGMAEQLSTRYGASVTPEIYGEYLVHCQMAQEYADDLYSRIAVSEEEISDYYQRNLGNYTDLTISKQPNVNVRHILLLPQGDTTEAIEAEIAVARSLMDDLETAGNHVEDFERYVQEYSRDSGSRENGGWLENLYPGAIGGGFDEWCFAATGHEIGALGVARSQFGVHLIRFEGVTESYHWKEVVAEDMKSERLSQYYMALLQNTKCHLTHFAKIEA